MVANPTLLQPGTWAWQVHYGSCPCSSFYPLGFEEDLPQLLLQVVPQALPTCIVCMLPCVRVRPSAMPEVF